MNSEHVSVINKDKSRKNILTKIEILKKWGVEGIPNKLDVDGNQVRDTNGEIEFEWVPISILDFSKWDGSQNSPQCLKTIGVFKTVSRETLNKKYNNDLNQLAQQTLKLIKVKLLQQTEGSNKLGTIQKLTRDLDYWRILASTLSTDIAQLRSQFSESEIEVRKLQRSLINNRVEAERLINAKNSEISALRESLSKISILKLVNNSNSE